jgi:hypothetical protein
MLNLLFFISTSFEIGKTINVDVNQRNTNIFKRRKKSGARRDANLN